MSELSATPMTTPQRLDPRSFIARAVTTLGRMGVPLAFAAFAILDKGEAAKLFVAIPALVGIMGLSLGIAYLRWRRLTYWVGEQDIRVESGIVSRAARSVPYERIQDVSLEQKLVPRLFGLVEVRFETGSGGGEDLKLAYLSETEGERLRDTVRARKQGEAIGDRAEAVAAQDEEQATTLFAMDPPRLLKFGLFEFSLAVVAVLFGATQQFDFLLPFDPWDVDEWRHVLAGPGAWLAGLGFAAQVIGAILASLSLIVLGFATGVIRTVLRDWGFLLEQTSRGFRRRRGLLTRTDVMMPRHRVQAVEIGTRLLRYRFGWHGLKFISLAQDAGSANHVVAPFAQMGEIEPIVRAAGFHPAACDVEWHRASTRYRFDSVMLEAGFFILAALPVAIFAPVPFFLIPLAIAGIVAAANLYAWRFHRHATDRAQIFSLRGFLSPTLRIARRIKLHSVEISQGPIAQRHGYATLNLGLAGGSFAIRGIPIEEAHELREAILTSIAAKDFSELA